MTPDEYRPIIRNRLGGRRSNRTLAFVLDTAAQTVAAGGHPCRWCGEPTPLRRKVGARPFSFCTLEHRTEGREAIAAAVLRRDLQRLVRAAVTDAITPHAPAPRRLS